MSATIATTPHAAALADVRTLRTTATRLRRAAERIDGEADQLERDIGLASGLEPLGGRALIDKLCELRAVGERAHYTVLVHDLALAGVQPRGTDPDASLLAALGRDPRWRSPLSRTGIYERVL